MFGFSSSSTLLAGQHDAGKERDPPSRPTPVIFPSFDPPEPSLDKLPAEWQEGGISSRLIKIKKPSDINIQHLNALNVSFKPDCEVKSLLSDESLNYFPPKEWLDSPGLTEDPSESSEPTKLLSNGRKPPDRRDFYLRAKELYYKNEDAFAVLTRKGKSDQPPPRLAHFRRFWEGLDNMAYYWDDSLDEYIPPKPDEPADKTETDHPTATDTVNLSTKAENLAMNEEEPRKKAKTSPEEASDAPVPPTEPATPGNAQPIRSSMTLPARTNPPKVPWAPSTNSAEPANKVPGTYKGNRIGNGADMPDQYRLDTVRSFLEPVAWAFGLTFVPHRRPPTLAVENIRFPVRMGSVAWRAPTDRMKARSGWLEGPVLGLQCRPETAFGSNGTLEDESMLDAVRELGGLLLLAQERAREGKTEIKAGEGKWWVTVPRWGGGLGGEVGDARNSDAPVQKEQKAEPRSSKSRNMFKERKKLTPADAWKALKPSNPSWDQKTVYEAIGKDRDSEWDEIFMVSSLNHHISILKLRVHQAYMDHLLDASSPSKAPSDPYWSSPILQRTRWLDLFNVDDRMEAMRGIWGITAYLMRSQDQPDVAMNNQ